MHAAPGNRPAWRTGRRADQDYRDVTGGDYDAVGALEMGEHVGAGVPGLRRPAASKLKPGRPPADPADVPGGRAPGGGAFIESYIAPDMHMRPVGRPSTYSKPPGSRSRSTRCASTTPGPSPPGGQPGAALRGGNRLGRAVCPGLAALPGGRRAGLRRGPDGRATRSSRSVMTGTAAALAATLVISGGRDRGDAGNADSRAARRAARVIDMAWGLGFALVAVVASLSAGHGVTGRRLLVTVLTVVWGVRLAATSAGEPRHGRGPALRRPAG